MPSSVIRMIQYDPGRSLLRVIFNSGNVYEYQEVPEKVYKEMKTARSKGRFLNTLIKKNYTYKKIS